MEHTMLKEYVSELLFIAAILVFGVNIITQVVKKLFPKVPVPFLVTALSVTVTVAAFLAWAAVREMPILWYNIAAVMVLGIFVAYAAMFGFDTFRQAIKKLKELSK